VGILETDSFQSVSYGAAAFSRISDLPFIQESVPTWLTDNLFLPSMDGVSASKPLRIVQSVDPAEPPSPDNLANVALIPLAGDGAALKQAFASAYAEQTPQGDFTLFSAPANSNRPPRVAVAVSDRHMLASPSLPALAWAWENRARLIGAPAQSLPGTFRVLVNPQRFADLLGLRNGQTAAFFDADKLIRDFETLSFSVTLEGASFAVALRGTPKTFSALDTLATSWRLPAPLWNAMPDNAFFSSLGAFDRPDLWAPFLGKSRPPLLRPVNGHVPRTAFGGERLMYLAPTRDGSGLCLVQLETVKDAPSVQKALRDLGTVDTEAATVTFAHRGERQAGGATVETYAISVPAPAPAAGGSPGGASIVHPLLSLLLKRAVLETAVTNGYLVTVIGPEGAIDAQMPPPDFAPKTLTLNRLIGGQDPSLDDRLMFGGQLRIAELLRHTVSIIPEVTPEQARLMPKGGDGATFGINQTDRTLTVSLRFHSNEIAALQRINRDGRAMLQEVFFHIFSNQLMEQKKKTE
jgi:hypothetical protein